MILFLDLCTTAQFPLSGSSTCIYENITCSAAANITNATPVELNRTHYLGDTLNYTCEENHRHSGSLNATCDYSGEFTTNLVCILKEHAATRNDWKIAVGVVLPTCTVLLASIVAIYVICKRKSRSTELRNRLKDAFVSYFDKGCDKDYVRETLCPKLEQEPENPFKLLIHERDFRAGTLILNNIMNAIRGTNSAIIIMSEGYVNAAWCREEFQECVEEAKLDKRFKIFVILMQPLNTLIALENCSEYMKKYFRDETCLHKDDPNLFEKLVSYLRELQSQEENIEEDTNV